MELGLARNWWAIALRGVLAIVFGVLAFFWPGILWLTVVLIFAAYAFVDGCLAIYLAVTGHAQGGQWWALVFEGLIGIVAAVLTVAWPAITELAFLYVIAGWAVLTGVFEIVAAIRLRRYIRGEWILAVSGVLSILLGLALGLMPLAGLVALAWIIGAYAVAFGVLLVALAFRLRSLARHAYRPPEPVTVP
jgi:uncharacterized membrane protein HdeD (DUF308 family)